MLNQLLMRGLLAAPSHSTTETVMGITTSCSFTATIAGDFGRLGSIVPLQHIQPRSKFEHPVRGLRSLSATSIAFVKIKIERARHHQERLCRRDTASSRSP